MKLNIGKAIASICTGLLVLGAGTVHAQKTGQSVKIQAGYVVGAEEVDVKDSKAVEGAIIGGSIALLASHGRHPYNRRRRVVGGAIVGGLIGNAAGGTEMAMMYTVEVSGGAIKVVTDQFEIHLDDCVVVEQSGDSANIRRVDYEVCNPESTAVTEALSAEFQEEAEQCAAAKAEVAAAKTNDAVDLAMKKVSILCNG